jgi:hypothetical protein
LNITALIGNGGVSIWIKILERDVKQHGNNRQSNKISEKQNNCSKDIGVAFLRRICIEKKSITKNYQIKLKLATGQT